MTAQPDELRKEAAARSAKLGKGATRVSAMLDGAADEIGRLRAENEWLRKAAIKALERSYIKVLPDEQPQS